MNSKPIKSNIAHWQAMQDNDYFENHGLYGEAVNDTDFDCQVINGFYPLDQAGAVVVIGCGYGRESTHIARRAGHVYGIDVSRKILDKAVQHTRDRGVENFTPVLAERFAEDIPSGIDLVFSHVVFQHLTRDLAHNYLKVLAGKLSPGGAMVIQFCEDFNVAPDNDADLEVYEPSVSYNVRQIVEMAQPWLKLESARSVMATDAALWHWAHLTLHPDYVVADPGVAFEPLGDGRQRIDLDLTAAHQSYRNPGPPDPQGAAAFSTGGTGWDYLASVALALDGATAGVTLEAVVRTLYEPVFLLAVDQAYGQVGERRMIMPGSAAQTVRLDLPAGAYALVVQATDDPRAEPVLLQRVTLYLP